MADDTQLPPIAMLGGGNMNGAILAGLLASPSRPAEPIRVTTKSAASAERYAGAEHVAVASAERDPEANRAAVRGAGIVVVGVKPVAVAGLLDEIGEALAPDAVVISVAAGIPLEAIEARLPDGAAAVRAMPNTPATVRMGATGIAAGRAADARAMALARAVFASVGEVAEVPEAQLAAVTAASGSGPAYVYLLAERMIEAAVELGLEADIARELVVATVRGAGEMLVRSADAGPAELRRRVTSPNGTTERAIQVLDAEDLAGAVRRAMAANAARADEMAREFAAAATDAATGERGQ